MNQTSSNNSGALFEPYQLADISLSNRIAMAPMTRSRAYDGSPDSSVATYYAQRATAGLIITEGVVVSPSGRGFLYTPGIYNAEQVQRWRSVTEAVHRKGGRIFAQLWHVGRMSHVTLQPGGESPVSSTQSAVKTEKVFAFDGSGVPAQLYASEARALRTEEIEEIVRDFAIAATNAVSAGFDGVEIHAANGYLFDQFINGALNVRDDKYGGATIGDRLRFLLEAVDAVSAKIGQHRVGVRLSPFGRVNDMPEFGDEHSTHLQLIEELDRRRLAYLHLNDMGIGEHELAAYRSTYCGSLILCGNFDREHAEATIKAGRADMIAFGRSFIGNPDLVSRLKYGWPLTNAPRETYYQGGDRGFIDFPEYSPIARQG